MIREILAAAALLLAQAAHAEGPIEIREGRSFTHTQSATEFPGRVSGLKLTRMHDFSDHQYDVVAVYGDIADGDEVSVYLYRAPIPDVSLWSGAVIRAVQSRGEFAAANPADAVPRFFAPPGADAASAMRTAYNTQGGRIASTGVALVQYGDWLLKIRASSTQRTAAEIDTLIDAALAAFPIPAGAGKAGPAYLVQPCADALELAPAELAEDGKETAVGATVLAVLISSIPIPEERLMAREGYTPPEPIVWCEDPSRLGNLHIFRPNERKDAYVIGMSDAGLALSVGHWADRIAKIAEEMGTLKIPVMRLDADGVRILALYGTVPTPGQAYEAIGRGTVLGSTDRASSVQISPDIMKK